MKICFYCDSVFTVGGVQRVLAVIAKGLSANHEVVILTADDPAHENLSLYGLQEANIRFKYIHYPNLPFYEYYPAKAYSLFYKKILPKNKLTTRLYTFSSFPYTYRRRLMNVLQKENFDVIVGVHVYPSLYLSAVKKHLQACIVGWLHTSFYAFFNLPGRWLWKAEDRFSYQMKLLDRVVVLTRCDQQLYRQKMGLDTEVIYNPLTLEPQGKGDPAYKKFLAVGRMSYLTKGFDLLIEAFSVFARRDGEWSLEIVGEGEEEVRLHQLISRYGLNSRVTIFPFTPEIQRHYARASVFVLSSRWEGFPLVLAEAMAHGLPILASDIPVVRELLQDASNTMMFRSEDIADLAEKMWLISRRTDLAEMGKESSKQVEKLQLPVLLGKWERLISELAINLVTDKKQQGHIDVVNPE